MDKEIMFMLVLLCVAVQMCVPTIKSRYIRAVASIALFVFWVCWGLTQFGEYL